MNLVEQFGILNSLIFFLRKTYRDTEDTQSAAPSRCWNLSLCTAKRGSQALKRNVNIRENMFQTTKPSVKVLPAV